MSTAYLTHIGLYYFYLIFTSSTLVSLLSVNLKMSRKSDSSPRQSQSPHRRSRSSHRRSRSSHRRSRSPRRRSRSPRRFRESRPYSRDFSPRREHRVRNREYRKRPYHRPHTRNPPRRFKNRVYRREERYPHNRDVKRICRYYNTPRGCRKGDDCDFTHISYAEYRETKPTSLKFPAREKSPVYGPTDLEDPEAPADTVEMGEIIEESGDSHKNKSGTVTEIVLDKRSPSREPGFTRGARDSTSV